MVVVNMMIMMVVMMVVVMVIVVAAQEMTISQIFHVNLLAIKEYGV
jgi:hypothetical protein